MFAIDSIRRRQVLPLLMGLAFFAASADRTSPAVALAGGALVKGNGPAVYYVSDDGTRHVFPSQAVFDSWFPDRKATITALNTQELAALKLGTNMTFKPGVKLIKIMTNPKVYAVSRYGVMHWITTESLASDIYGANWKRLVVDVPDAFFSDYTEGAPIYSKTDFSVSDELATVKNPEYNFMDSAKQTDGWMTASQKRRTAQLVSLLENGTTEIQYGYVENLDDGRGYTMGRSGFTTANGDAYLVVQRYAYLEPKNALVKYLPVLKTLAEQESGNVSGVPGLPVAWATAAKDSAFLQAQDQVTDELYYVPAMQKADELGIKSALGRAILFDTIIQHGGGTGPDSLQAIVDRTVAMMQGSPLSNVDENKWLNAFLVVRSQNLLSPSNMATKAVWAESESRLDVWQQLLNAHNLDLEGTIQVNTTDFRGTIY